ncbi:MAG: MmcQ/YjbR family DNA-binding protein [Sphingomonadaceae bacterium]|nr:MmcQ/YjbR family DNA-binding protein [Sphingomonadaceae bacterium]
MNLDEYNAFCAALPAVDPDTDYVVQWGGSHVWKVGGKVFAIAGWSEDRADTLGVTFKTSQIAFEMLRDIPGCRPAPYMASRGMKWIQHYAEPGLGDDDLKDYLARSHELVAAGLSKKRQRELGLLEE